MCYVKFYAVIGTRVGHISSSFTETCNMLREGNYGTLWDHVLSKHAVEFLAGASSPLTWERKLISTTAFHSVDKTCNRLSSETERSYREYRNYLLVIYFMSFRCRHVVTVLRTSCTTIHEMLNILWAVTALTTAFNCVRYLSFHSHHPLSNFFGTISNRIGAGQFGVQSPAGWKKQDKF